MEPFKLPQANYDALSRIIRSYGSKSKPASLSEIANTATLDISTVSRNHAFLANVGLIEGGKTKISTPLGKELARALDHQIEPDVSRLWREAIGDIDFTGQILTATRIRNGMDREALQSHIVYTSGQTKSQLNNSGALAFIDILLSAGLLAEHDGLLTVSDQTTSDSTINTDAKVNVNNAQERLTGSVDPSISSHSKSEQPLLQLVIRVNLSIASSDLDGIGERLGREIVEIQRYLATDGINISADVDVESGASIV